MAEGTYAGTIELKNGVKVYGGFHGTESTASASNPDTYITNISGGAPVVKSENNDSTAVLRGFRIINGTTATLDPGAGLRLNNSSAVFVRCTFANNVSPYMGGGASIHGGGSPRFVNCKFYHNQGEYAGGAVLNWEGSPTFENCLFYENTGGDGGAVAVAGGVATFINCTLAYNTASIGNGGGLYDYNGQGIVRNCIFWNNDSVNYDSDEIYNRENTTTVTYSDVKGGREGTGNINSDPKFINPAGDDYRIGGTFQSPSPCKNTGSGPLVPPDVADLDWDGNTSEQLPKDLTAQINRFAFGGVDMGAYEWTFEEE